MTPDEIHLKRQFFLEGAQTYLDVLDAIAEFEGQVTERCKNAAMNRLAEIHRACGTGFWPGYRLRDYNQTSNSYRRLGVKLADRDDTRLCFCLELPLDKTPAYRALVFLWRAKMDAATDLWAARTPAIDAGIRLKGDHELRFGPGLSEAELPNFDAHLDEAIDAFIDFVQNAGGLEKHFPRHELRPL